MPDRVNDDLRRRDLVENQIGIGRRRDAADRRVARAATNMGMQQEEVGDYFDAGVHTSDTLRRLCGDVIEDVTEIGERRDGIAKLHRPCLARTARTCSSVANSPRAAAAFDFAMARS